MSLWRTSTSIEEPRRTLGLTKTSSTPLPGTSLSAFHSKKRQLAGLLCSEVPWHVAERHQADIPPLLQLPCVWSEQGKVAVVSRLVPFRMSEAHLARAQFCCHKAKFAAPLLGFSRPDISQDATLLFYGILENGTLESTISSMSWLERLNAAHCVATALWNLHSIGESYTSNQNCHEDCVLQRMLGMTKDRRARLLWVGSSRGYFEMDSHESLRRQSLNIEEQKSDLLHFGMFLLFLLSEPMIGIINDTDVRAAFHQFCVLGGDCHLQDSFHDLASKIHIWPRKEATCLLQVAWYCLHPGSSEHILDLGDLGTLGMQMIVTFLAGMLVNDDAQNQYHSVDNDALCCVCLESSDASVGLLCSHSRSHPLLCGDCIEPYIQSLIGTAELRKYEGGLKCLACSTHGEENHCIFPRGQVQQRLDGVVLRQYLDFLDSTPLSPSIEVGDADSEDDSDGEFAVLLERKNSSSLHLVDFMRVSEHAEVVVPRRVKQVLPYTWLQLQGDSNFYEFEPSKMRLRQHMSARVFALRVSELMNLTCPKCECLLDPDPDGCAAMTCLACDEGFCWMCFEMCGEDAHPHVIETHGTYFPTPEHVAEWHSRWRWKRVHDVLVDLLPETQTEALNACMNTLKDLLLWPFPDREPDMPARLVMPDFDPPDGLIEAARRGDLVALAGIIDAGNIDLNMVNERGMTALCFAAHEGRSDAIRMLLARNADPNLGDFHGVTPLHYACREPPFEILDDVVSAMLQFDIVEANPRDATNSTPIMVAAEIGRHQVIPSLLACERVQPNLCNYGGFSAVMLASAYGHEAVLEHLLGCDRVDVGQRTNTGKTILHLAAESGSILNLTRLTLHPLVDLNATSNLGRTALMEASARGLPAIVSALIDCPGINIDSQDHHGSTSLMLAAQAGSFESFECILASSQNVNACDSFGKTVLMLLAERGRTLDMMSHTGLVFFLSHCQKYRILDVNAKCKQGRTALMHATASGCLHSVRSLLELGDIVDLTVRDESGETARSITSSLRPELFQILRKLLPSPEIESSGLIVSDGVVFKNVERVHQNLISGYPDRRYEIYSSQPGDKLFYYTLDMALHEVVFDTNLTVEYSTMSVLKFHKTGWYLYDATHFFEFHELGYVKRTVVRVNGHPSVDVSVILPQDYVSLNGLRSVKTLASWELDGWELRKDDSTWTLGQWGVLAKVDFDVEYTMCVLKRLKHRRLEESNSCMAEEEEESVDACSEFATFLSAF